MEALLLAEDEICEKDERLEDGMTWLGLKSIFLGRLILLLSKNWFLKAKCLDT